MSGEPASGGAVRALITRQLGLVCLAALAVVTAAFGLPGFFRQAESQLLVSDAKSPEDAEQALTKLSATELDGLSARERARLEAEPLDRTALQNLTLVAALQGKKDQQEQLALVLASYARRSVKAQVAAIEILFGKGDYANALEHIDGVLRSGSPNSQARKLIFDGLSKVVTDSRPRVALVKKLAENPPWREQLLKHIFASDKDGRLGYELISEMRQAKSPPSQDELRGYLASAFEKKLYDLAYFVWLDSLEPAELSRSGLIFDGSFDLVPKNLNFGWNLLRAPTFRAGFEQALSGKKDTSLSVNFFDSRENFYHVFQHVMLQPGSYDLKGVFMSDNFRSEGGLKWRFRCLNAAQTILAESEAFKQPSPESPWRMTFEVPPADCQVQFLRLESASRATADQRYKGRVFFDNLEIGPIVR
jgi:hypothetical protein